MKQVKDDKEPDYITKGTDVSITLLHVGFGILVVAIILAIVLKLKCS